MENHLALGLAGLLGMAFLGGVLFWRPPLRALSPWIQLALAAAAAWTLGEILANAASTVETKRLALLVLYAGSISMPALWLVLVFRWVGLHSPTLLRITRDWQAFPLAVASGFYLALLTQPWHGALVEPVVGGRNEYGVLYPWLLGFGFLEVGVAVAISLKVARSHPVVEIRRAGLLMALAPALLLMNNVVYATTDFRELSQLTGVLLAGGGLAAALAVWGGREFWLLPVAIREVVECDSSAVLILGAKGRPCYWNAAAEHLLGDAPITTDARIVDGLVKRVRVIDALPPKDGTGLEELLAESGSRGTVVELLADPGRFLRLCLQPIRRGGQAVASALRVEDVSERILGERARSALVGERIEAEKLRHLALVASDLADDFAARLSAIASSTVRAADEEDQGQPVIAHLHDIAHEAEQALMLTQQLLAIGGRSAPNSANTSARQLVERTISQLESQETGTLCVASFVTPELPLLRADLAQVVGALVAVSRQARARMERNGGHLTLLADLEAVDDIAGPAYTPPLSPGHYVMISVVDDGRPMTPAERDTLLSKRAPLGATRTHLELSAGVARLLANGAALAAGAAEDRGNIVRIAFPVETELGA